MKKQRFLVAQVLFAVACASARPTPDQLTPLVAVPLTASTQPFQGSDGRLHVVYELVLTNASPTRATLNKIEVLDAPDSSNPLATYDGQQLLSRLRTTARGTVESTAIEFNNTRIFLIDITLDPGSKLPERLWHRFELLGGSSPSPKPETPIRLTYTVAPIDLSRKLPHIGPPLAGKGWVAANGCCHPDSIHRSSSLTVNGGIYFAQRFAIDWILLDDAGQLVHGDPSDVHNYPCYGASALAVADATVVESLDELDDQKPGTLPDPKTITLQNVDGNHVVLDVGDGVFAFYAHLQRGSALVKSGDRVKRGQILGKVGNTGNTSAPHLHFHLMEGTSVLGSNGIPYAIDSFAIDGQVPEAEFAAATGVEGNFGN
jgi:hypothetical protein